MKRTILIFLALIVASAFLFSACQSVDPRPEISASPETSSTQDANTRGTRSAKWEYDTQMLLGCDAESLNDINDIELSCANGNIRIMLDRRGSDGWELVNVTLEGGIYTLFFKRPLQ